MKTMTICIRSIGLLMALLIAPASNRAGFMIEVRDVMLTPGEAGTIDVVISSSDSSYNLLLFQYKFTITAAPGSVGILSFTQQQSDSETAANNYVLGTESAGFISNPQNSPAYDELVGGDFSVSDEGVHQTGETLLVRLDVEHNIPIDSDPTAFLDDFFLVSLVLDDDTFFFGEGFAENTVTSSRAGQIRIVATPEPTSIVLLGMLAVLAQLVYRHIVHARLRAVSVACQ